MRKTWRAGELPLQDVSLLPQEELVKLLLASRPSGHGDEIRQEREGLGQGSDSTC